MVVRLLTDDGEGPSSMFTIPMPTGIPDSLAESIQRITQTALGENGSCQASISITLPQGSARRDFTTHAPLLSVDGLFDRLNTLAGKLKETYR